MTISFNNSPNRFGHPIHGTKEKQLNQIYIDTSKKNIRIYWSQGTSNWFDIKIMVKSVPGCTFAKRTRDPSYWKVPATPFHAQRIVEMSEDWLFSSFTIDPKIRELAAQEDERTNMIPSRTKFPNLYNHQNTGVVYIFGAGFRCLIGDEPGTGKTITVLTALKELGPELRGKVLIISPSIVTLKWKAEAEKWCDFENPTVIKKGKQMIEDGMDAVIMIYEMAKGKELELSNLDFTTVIFDEAHRIKNRKAGRAISARRYSSRSKYIVMMTGTPFINRIKDLHNLVDILQPGQWDSFHNFAIRYCNAAKGEFGWDYSGSSNQPELAKRLKSVMRRVTKRDVTDMPPITESILPLPHTYKFKKIPGETALQEIGRQYREIGAVKSILAVRWIKEFVEEDPSQKLVVYAHHLDIVDYIEETLNKAKISTLQITGRDSETKKQEKANAFQSSPTVKVIVINSAASEGVDLYASSNLLLVEREWSPIQEKQQVYGRIDRIGQIKPCTMTIMFLPNTIDRYFVELGMLKDEDFTEIVGTDSIIGGMKQYILTELDKEQPIST